ncbi:MAG: LIC_10190 family membrane protein [Adhaeribacter sp.]
MVALLLSWLYIFFISFTGGLSLYEILQREKNSRNSPLPPAYLLSLTGLCILNGFAAYVSLFFPLTIGLPIGIGLLAAGYGIYQRKIYLRYLLAGLSKIKAHYFAWLIWGGLLLLYVSYLATTTPVNDDSGIYHSQSIKWIEQYKVIPGLGNLAGRYAFNSSYFLWSALFSFAALAGQPIFALNSYLVLLFGLITLSYLFRNFREKRNNKIGLFLAALFWLNLYFFNVWLSSPTPDIPAAILVAFIFLLLLQTTEQPATQVNHFYPAAIILLLLTCVTVKLSVAPALSFIFYLGYIGSVKTNRHWLFFLVAAFSWIVLPWLVRNVVLSGYLIFPFPAMDLFAFDWEVPRQLVKDEKDMVHSVAILLSPDWKGILDLKFQEWVPIWFRDHSPAEQVLLAAALFSPVLMAVGLLPGFRRRFSPDLFKRHYLIWLNNYGCVIYWFWLAPSIRFGSTFLFISALYPIYLALTTLKTPIFTILHRLVLLTFILWWLNSLRDAVYLARHQQTIFRSRLILPAKQPEVALKKVKLNNTVIWMPAQGFMCWNAPLPCTYALPIKVERRGKSLTQGFRVLRPTENIHPENPNNK